LNGEKRTIKAATNVFRRFLSLLTSRGLPKLSTDIQVRDDVFRVVRTVAQIVECPLNIAEACRSGRSNVFLVHVIWVEFLRG
jgi:hypothetical protein